MSESNLGSRADKFNNDKSQDLKRKRRTRNDEDGRNFSCNCGKSYLSYPALYTHVKTKHNGRPQFNKYVNGKEDNESAQLKDQQQVQEAQDSNNTQQLKKYLTKFFPFTQKEKDLDKKLKQVSKEDLLFIKNVKDYWEKHKKQDQQHQNEAYATPIDFVLGKFLIDMESDVSKSCQRFLADFILNLRTCLNELKNSAQFCKNNNAYSLPSIMNEIFTEKFQKFDDSHLYQRHPTIICKTIFHFCRWLFQERFTNLSLKFNTI